MSVPPPTDADLLATRVTALLQAPVAPEEASMTDALREALSAYSRDVPRQAVVDIPCNGSVYDFTLSTPYEDGFSSIERVEYPVGERPASYLPATEWGIYQTPTGAVLRLRSLTPASGQHLRVTYTARHHVTGLDAAESSTVPTWHWDALVALAAARLLTRFADEFLHEEDPTLQVDATNRQSKSDLARKRARDLETYYRQAVARDRAAGASLVIDWDMRLLGGGLTHRERWR